MRSKRISTLAATGVSLFISCGDHHYVHYTVHVEHVDAPAAVASEDRFHVKLAGTLGPDGCHSFSHLRSMRGRDHVEVQAIGKRLVGDDVGCKDESVPLEAWLAVYPPYEGETFTVVVRQPDGTTTEQIVRIRD